MTELERRAEGILDELLPLPATNRLAAAKRACGDDAPLLLRVQSLLSAAPTIDGFFADDTIDSPAEAIVIEQVGTMIGRYKLLEQIGEGGFGVVFMAEQEKPVRRRVALKVIKLGMDTREVVARFEAERQALALMDHPNIAKVLDAGATDTGRPYFVMELVRGLPVTEYADKHKLSTRDRVALAAQVCRAVQHAHSKGIIHRDLKPSNVLVTTADDKPLPKVIDFGIAKATQSKLTDRTLFTQFRQMIGTPQYMSPEQADSEGVDVDTRTDVYSLGVLMYELLVGTTPFDAKMLRGAAFEAMRKIIRDTDVPRPATRLHTLAGDAQSSIASARSTDLKKLEQSIKGELDWIVMKALEKDRSRRYETASAMADDLTRYLVGDAVLAGPVNGMYRLKKLARRYKAGLAVAAVIGMVLLVGIAGTTIGLVRESRQRRVAETERNEAERAHAEADRQRIAAQAMADEFQGLVLASQLRYDESEPFLKRGWEFRRQTQGEDGSDTVAALSAYTQTLVRLKQSSKARELFDVAVAYARRAGRADMPSFAWLRSWQATFLMQFSAAEAIAPLRDAVRIYAAQAPDDRNRGNTMFNLGCCLANTGQLDEAEAVLRENFAWDRTHSGDYPAVIPNSLKLLNKCLLMQKKPAEGNPTPTTAATSQPVN